MYRHAVGTVGKDVLVYEEKDERFDIGTGKTRSKAYIFLFSGSHTTTEVRYIPADQPTAEWKIVEPRKQDVEYYPDHNGDSFYIRVNDTGRNFRLVKAPVSDPRKKNWQELRPNRADVMLEDTDYFKNYYVLYEREKGLNTTWPVARPRCLSKRKCPVVMTARAIRWNASRQPLPMA